MNDQIELATAMGWWMYKDKYWQPPSVTKKFCDLVYNGPVRINWDATPLPDPFQDANDCEALMRYLAEKRGVIFTIWYPCAEDQTAVDCSRDGYVLDRIKWSGDDWKQGVCELALKVLRA